MQSLNQLQPLRRFIVRTKWRYFTKVWGMDIHPTVQFSLRTRFDMTYPRGVHVAERTYIAFNAVVLTHDRTRGLYLHTRIGPRCFIGANSMILPGVTVGEGSIVGAGAVVTADVPPHSIVAGNPARVIREDVEVGDYGRLRTANDTEAKLRASGAWD
jgi:acetyltransferase-like isoleucine patch superfamily enzyme